MGYGIEVEEPWVSSGEQHTWNSAIGDFMKTSQWAYGNVDGGTTFWTSSSTTPLNCSVMASSYQNDGTLGRKEFYEERGYTVTDCYNLRTDNQVPGAFSLADFRSEIDAGHPVMINLHNPDNNEGHTIVGFGYDSSNSSIYYRDTWDNNPANLYQIVWGGSLDGMSMRSVSIVHLEETSSDFSKSSPADQSSNLNPSSVTLSWGASNGAASYEYCLSDNESCSSWTPNGASTSVTLHDLTGGTTFYWQVRAKDGGGAVIAYADGAEGAYWEFSTFEPALMTEQAFIPLILK